MSQSHMYGRPVRADVIREFWVKIKYCAATNTPTTIDNLINQLQKSLGWNADECELKLKQCLDCGVLVKKLDPTTRQECYFIPEDAPDPQPEHDWYCFVCHLEGTVSPCKSCFRVYHPTCLTFLGIVEKSNGFTCPACMAAAKPPIVDRNIVFKQLDLILTWVLSKAGTVFDLLPDDSADMTEEQCQWIVARHMDLNNLRNKTNRGHYLTSRQFAVDFELLVHDVILVFGKDSNNGQLIQQIWKEVKSEIDAFENGVTGPITGRTDYVEAKPKSKRRSEDQSDMSLASLKKRKKSDHGLDSDISSRSVMPKDPAIIRPSFAALLEQGDSSSLTCGCDVKYKQLILELQSHWLTEFKQDREKALSDLAERMHRDFLSDQEKLRGEMLGQFKQELEATKKDLDQRYAQQLKQEIQKLMEKQKKQVSETKKKQWCWQCEAEAIYHCCWNTAYCSVECQQAHWTQHRKYCRRKKQPQN